MAEKRRFIDVWLVEPNTVYREVPYTVVADWIQQSRLLPEDKIRPSGTAEWFQVGESPDFKPYVPQPEPYRVEDQAEALESVHTDFTWRRRDEDDDDVDMIPLIDVSLVLLIFFMLTSTAVTASALINTPPAFNGLVVGKEQMLWVNIDLPNGPGTLPVFSVSEGDGPPAEDDRDLSTITSAVDKLLAKVNNQPGTVNVTIRAHKDVESGVVRELTVIMTREGFARITKKYIAVSEKGAP